MKQKVSLWWRLVIYLSVLTLSILAVLLLFQFVLLEPMYEANKISTVKRVGDDLAEILTEDEDEYIYQKSLENDVCIRVISDNNTDYTQGDFGCPLYRLEPRTIIGYIDNAKANGNEYISKENTFFDRGGPKDFHSIILTKIVESGESESVIMVHTTVSPVDATTETLKSQLMYIFIIFVVFILIFSYLLNKKIAKPLISINDEAKNLAHGQYNLNFANNQYLEAQELNETLAQAAIDIQKADTAKKELISNISHDLRTPLTMIKGYGEMMLDLPTENNEESIKVIIDEADRLNYLVEDLLDLSRLDTNNITLQRENVDIDEIIKNQLKKYEVYTQNDGFKINLNDCGRTIVNVDKKRIEQVFNNFMTNAINYSLDDKRIDITLRKEDDLCYVEVKDYGAGIPEDKIKDIWDRYYKVNQPHIRFNKGSGIGLSIAKEILELHGFKYGVTSKLNEGSTFWFAIPIINEEKEAQE